MFLIIMLFNIYYNFISENNLKIFLIQIIPFLKINIYFYWNYSLVKIKLQVKIFLNPTRIEKMKLFINALHKCNLIR